MKPWTETPRHQSEFETARARELRQSQTDAERNLWSELRGRRLLSLKFRRQASFGHYYLDFYCAELKVALEIDGAQHFTDEGKSYDAARDAYLVSNGLTVIRYSTLDVLKNRSGVLEDLKKRLLAAGAEASPALPSVVSTSPFQGEV